MCQVGPSVLTGALLYGFYGVVAVGSIHDGPPGLLPCNCTIDKSKRERKGLGFSLSLSRAERELSSSSSSLYYYYHHVASISGDCGGYDAYAVL
jgi:hypothetical protein